MCLHSGGGAGIAEPWRRTPRGCSVAPLERFLSQILTVWRKNGIKSNLPIQTVSRVNLRIRRCRRGNDSRPILEFEPFRETLAELKVDVDVKSKQRAQIPRFFRVKRHGETASIRRHVGVSGGGN